MKRIANHNGIEVDESLLIDIKVSDLNAFVELLLISFLKFKAIGKTIDVEDSQNQCENSHSDESTLTYFTNSAIIKILALNSFALLASEIAYTGLHYNLRNLETSIAFSYFLLGSVELPGYVLGWFIITTRLGRRWSTCVLLLFTSSVLFAGSLVPQEHIILVVIFSMLGKLGSSPAYMVITLQAPELLPTPIRNQGLSFSYLVLSVGSIFIPYIIHLGKYGTHIPLIIIGTINAVAGITASFLTETQNRDLPQTLQDTVKYSKQFKYWSLAPRG